MLPASRREFLQLAAAALVPNINIVSQARAGAGTDVGDLIELTHSLLESLSDPALAGFLAEWPRTRERRPQQAAQLAVLRWLPQTRAEASPLTAPLVAEVIRVARSLTWRRTYREPEVATRFLDNYGYTELAGLIGPVPSEHLAWGFLLLGPETLYPRHRHEAEEIYVPLAGTASWEHGNEPWHVEPVGAVVHHVSDEPHAMRTHSEPLLALYLWHSQNLNQRSRLDPG